MGKKIVFTPASGVMSHVVRSLVIGRALKERGHEVIFAGLPKYLQDPSIVPGGEFGYYLLPDFTTDEAMEALRSMKRHYTRGTILSHIQEELKMFDEVRPDLVVSDFRLTTYISARVAQVPVVSLLNARWLGPRFHGTYHAPDTHPIPLAMKTVLGKRLADTLWLRVLNLIQRYKLSPYYYASKKYHLEKKPLIPDLVEGEYNLILDTNLLGPTRDLPPHFLQVGPVIWSPYLPVPAWVKDLDRQEPVIYVTMGSSGHRDLFKTILDTFRASRYQVIISTGGQIVLRKENIPENFYVEKYLPGDKIMEMADIVICHGGNQTVYQTVQAGRPAIVIATHLDQEWGGEMLEAHQAGIFLTMIEVLKKPSFLIDSVNKMFDNLVLYQAHMGKLREDLSRYNPVAQAAAGIESFLDGKIHH